MKLTKLRTRIGRCLRFGQCMNKCTGFDMQSGSKGTKAPDRNNGRTSGRGASTKPCPCTAAITRVVRSFAKKLPLNGGEAGVLFGPNSQLAGRAGKLAENLQAAGIDRAKITKIVFTHAHPDHLWGVADDVGTLRFPNASYFVAEKEWNFWMAEDVVKKLPENFQRFALGAKRDLSRIKDKLKTVKPGDDIVSGVRILDTPGHTPGHISLEIAGGEGLIIVGDVAVNAAVSFAHPEWRLAFDSIPELAIASRRRLLDRSATDKTRLLGSHWPYPGLGAAERKDGAYRFVATNSGTIR
jgi:glyoxylase-like metal-dependent hydrolase (beta-lactamase superfamily II)